MNTEVIVKEGRPLFWPWCAVMVTALISLIRPLHSIDWIGLLGIVLGIPLLATLPFGNEFQNRTLSLLLSQPVGRGRIWIEKSCVAFVAVASVVLLFAFSPLVTETLPDRGQQVNAVALIFAVVASATYWTLIARSTVGGIALSAGTVLLIAGFSSLATGIGANSLFLMTHFTSISITPLLCYAGLMLWLGERTLARYQVTGNMAGDDLLTTGSNVLLGAFSNRARSNPARPVWNLIHKELRLLRPVWLITVLAVSAWACFAFVELLRQQKTEKTLPLAIIAFGISSALIIAILAGCLSLGEEKTSGTYAWHRTLPISATRQWSIKLVVALFVSFICAGLIPVLLLIAGRRLFPSAFPSEDANFQLAWLLGALFLTLFSFWCACAVNGTVTAVAWVVPILAVVMLTPEMSGWAGRRLADFLILKFNLFANFRLTAFISGLGSQHLNGIINPFGTTSDPQILWTIFWIPSLILAVIQSYRLFRAPIRDGAASVARKLSPLVVLALLCSLFAFSFVRLSNQASERVFSSIFSVDRAIQNVLSNSANRETAQPMQLSADDLKKAYPPRVSPSSWLHDATLTIVPDKTHPTTCCEGHSFGGSRSFGRPWWNYTATVHLTSGAELNLSLEPPAESPTAPPKGEVRVRWPGKTSEESLLHPW
jgi:ABC-type transport system involved in multi-copper enzyme maturation permease subunit